MGNFYTNITLSTDKLQEVIDFLNEKNRHTYVYGEGSFVCVFPKNDRILFSFAGVLSKQFKCAAFAVMNHDDSLLLYQLFDSGKLMDDYNSCPGHFSGEEGPSIGGNAEVLSIVYSIPEEVDALNDVLRKDYVFEINRHDALIAKLEIPFCTAGGGFSYLKEGDLPEGLDISALIETAADRDAECLDDEDDENENVGLDIASSAASADLRVSEMLNNPDFIQQALKRAQQGADEYVKEMLEVQVLGTAGDGAVVVTSKGNLQFSGIKIKAEAIDPNDVGMLEDLVLAALNDAAQKTREKMEETKKRMLSVQLGQLGL
jgi:DNA-binding YbaB/EbfC family protein